MNLTPPTPVPSSSPANPAVPLAQAGGAAAATGMIPATGMIGSMGQLEAMAPGVAKAMLQSIAYNITTEMKKHQDRIKEINRESQRQG